MKFHRQEDLSASCEEWLAQRVSSQRVTAKLEALGSRSVSVSTLEESENPPEEARSWRVTMAYEMPTDAPVPFSRFLRPWTQVERTELWALADGGRCQGSGSVKLIDVPVETTLEYGVEPLGPGCRLSMAVEISCPVPSLAKTLNGVVGLALTDWLVEEVRWGEG